MGRQNRIRQLLPVAVGTILFSPRMWHTRKVMAFLPPGSHPRGQVKPGIAGKRIKIGFDTGGFDPMPEKFADLEAEFRQSLKRCRTAKQVITVLQDAAGTMPPNSIKGDNTTKIAWQVSPNVAALALRQLVDVLRSRRPGRTNAHQSDRELATECLPGLLENVGSTVLRELDQPSLSGRGILSLYSMSDVLFSLAALSRNDGKMLPLATKLCLLLEQHEPERITKRLGSRRLVDIIDSLSMLRLRRPSLLNLCFERLGKGDALSVLSARDLTNALRAMTVLDHIDGPTMTTFLKRWRKRALRDKASDREVFQMLFVARRLAKLVKVDGGHSDLYMETETLVYTLLMELTKRGTAISNNRPLSVAQGAAVLSTCVVFTVNGTHPIVTIVCDDLCNQRVMENASLSAITRSLMCLHSLKVSHHPKSISGIGQRFLRFVKEDITSLEPRTVNTILRSVVFLYPQENDVLEPFQLAAHSLFCDKKFLSCCDVLELVNFIWFLSKSRRCDVEALSSLVSRVLEPEMVDSFSAKLVCRVLLSFTTLVSVEVNAEGDSELGSLQSALFHSLGTHLLSTQLTPTETSGALFAYAKASYIQDMGIFDHLAQLLITMLDECTTRQISQCLWACGKMVVWESDQQDDIDDDARAPPYLSSARRYASYLSTRRSQLNAKDVSQCLWALGRLGTNELNVVYSMAFRAMQIVDDCNSQELANILWGLARLDYEGPDVILALTGAILHPSITPNPQESANILYALGRMEVRDERVFSKLSNAMMEQLDEASAQAIANALWAYRAVHIPPPQELLDRWAVQKLGLVSVPPGLMET